MKNIFQLSAKYSSPKQIKIPLFALIFGFFGLLPLAHSALQFDRTQGTDLIYKDGSQTFTVKTPYQNPEHRAEIGGENGLPRHVLYIAKSCEKCPDDVRSLYLQRADAKTDGKSKPMQFVYPGKVLEPKKNQVVYESRAFYGQCLPKVAAGYVVHQREHVGRRGYQRSVFVAQITPEGATEQLIERRLPTLTTTLQLVKRKVCFEIEGKTRTVLRRPLDLTPRQGMDDEESDEEDEEKPEMKSDPSTPNKS